jgi:uncharacterized protein affecting Mg2+/Co2+ transport
MMHHGMNNMSSFSASFRTTTKAFEKGNTTSIRLFRILMRLSEGLDYGIPLLKPLDPHDYGQARIFSMPSSHDEDVFRLFKKWNNEAPFIEEWFQSVSSCEEEPIEYEYTSLWINKHELKQAIRLAFRTSTDTTLVVVVPMQRLAIDAVQSLQSQKDIQKRTSISFHVNERIRVIATSRCIGMSSSNFSKSPKYRFAYRIRVENLPLSNTPTVQLFGRTWHIQDLTPDGIAVGEPIHVHMPTNGAVGHFPVLEPGQVFEYVSGCELATPHGSMHGSFHMALVPPKTKSKVVGDAISPNLIMFEMPVQPFSLVADR